MNFVPLAPSDLPRLKVVLDARLPESVMMRNAVQIAMTGPTEMEYYTQGAIDKNVIAIGVCFIRNRAEDPGFMVACLSTPHGKLSCAEAGALVDHLQAIGATEGSSWRPMMLPVTRDVSSIVVKVLLDKGAIVKATPCVGFCYPTGVGLSEGPQPPPGLRLNSLAPSSAQTVASHWSFESLTSGGTEATVRSLIERNPSVGLFSGRELVSWATCYDFGSITMLFTPEEHRGRGYASIILQGMVHPMALRGLVPTAAVGARNTVSLAAMDRAGFARTHELEYIFGE